MTSDVTMTPAQRLTTVLAGGRADRTPVFPKIWLNLAARLLGEPLVRLIEDPRAAMLAVVDAAAATRSDGARLFLFPSRRIERRGDEWLELDASGRPLGLVDIHGGLATRLDSRRDFCRQDPRQAAFRSSWTHGEPFVRNLAEARELAVPTRDFYESAGYGDMVRQVQSQRGEQIGLCGDCDSATLAFNVTLRGMHQALLDLIDEPRLAHTLMEKGTVHAIERGKFFLDAGVRILRLNDSVANMSVISPKQWGEFVFPHMKEVCDELHRYCPEAKIYCHICGNVLPIVGRLRETGLDCIGPLDPLGGFSVADARRAAGDDMVLMGGVNTLSFVHSAAGEVCDEARRCIEQGERGGRFVLGSGCALPSESKPENIAALVEASEKMAPRA